jgi:hypothetical protein
MKKIHNKIECRHKILNINKNINATSTLLPSIASLLNLSQLHWELILGSQWFNLWKHSW